MSSIAERLKSVRGEMSREEFARIIGVHVNTVGRYERGESEPDISITSKICREFDVNPHWLILGEGKYGIDSDHSGIPHFYETHGRGYRQYTSIGDDSMLLEIIVAYVLQENGLEMSKKQISAIANLYYEEMHNRIMAIAVKIKELDAD
ncbi:helix-turn-helix transcriptional regulator [Desulfovibrio sp. PG-178-WT-4]|uniref:Helix-turn-helix transcriptional regulator n=1 Tax=Desulfovibrio porci TaxID=2605782 RepID=A0A6L5XLM5_9BACT|nr:helix-turn-helix transcriptional regulator [Desulfovibrio porci]MSS28092.1 helix-turn-helix transcriptional regulator [Desulfovibrio porci]